MDISEAKDTNGTLGLLRQVYMYKKMYTRNFKAMTKAVEICQDPIVKELLIKCQQDTEELYITKGAVPPDCMSSEDLIIAYLLAYIRKNEIKVPADYNETLLFKESLDWLKDLSEKIKMYEVINNYTDSLEDCSDERNCGNVIPFPDV